MGRFSRYRRNAQLLVEGPRWQMVAAYAVAGVFFLVWLLQVIKPAGGRVGRPLLRRPAAGLGVALGVLGLAVSTALPMVFPVFGFRCRPGQMGSAR